MISDNKITTHSAHPYHIRKELKMTKILGIAGSPNKYGRTERLVRKALAGAASAGAETDVMHLGEENVKPCRGCNVQKCWEDGICKLDESAEPRNRRIKEADGIIFGAPVYFHGINGLAKDFIDKIRIPPRGRGSFHHVLCRTESC